MRIDRVVSIISTLVMVRRAGHNKGMTLSQVSKWSDVSRSTTYRYLLNLEALGFVETFKAPYRNDIATHYIITDAGESWMKGELFEHGII